MHESEQEGYTFSVAMLTKLGIFPSLLVYVIKVIKIQTCIEHAAIYIVYGDLSRLTKSGAVK